MLVRWSLGADGGGVKRVDVIARMEERGWTWDPVEQVFWRVHGLRIDVATAVGHLRSIDRGDGEVEVLERRAG